METYEVLSNERKRLQEQGELPDWFTTGGWQLFRSKYTNPDEQTFRARAATISRTAAGHTSDPKHWQPKFYDLIWKGWLSCSTPVLANMGTERGMAVSCSGGYVDDSVLGFYKARLESAVLSKNGFGTSSYLGDIRPRGSPISTGGVASGILPVVKGFVQDSQDITQG